VHRWPIPTSAARDIAVSVEEVLTDGLRVPDQSGCVRCLFFFFFFKYFLGVSMDAPFFIAIPMIPSAAIAVFSRRRTCSCHTVRSFAEGNRPLSSQYLIASKFFNQRTVCNVKSCFGLNGFYVLFFLWARRSYSTAEIQRRHRQLSYFVAAFTGTERRVTRQNIAIIIAGSPNPNILC
jgi:hypothetical protein